MSDPAVVPTPGRIVLYETDGRGGLRYALPAIVVITEHNYDERAADRECTCGAGKSSSPRDATPHPGCEYLPPPEGDAVHLRVFSPGADYTELNVPYAGARLKEGGWPPRTWRWPERA